MTGWCGLGRRCRRCAPTPQCPLCQEVRGLPDLRLVARADAVVETEQVELLLVAQVEHAERLRGDEGHHVVVRVRRRDVAAGVEVALAAAPSSGLA